MIAPRLLLCAWFVLGASVAEADIYRWDNGEVIPGTEGIEPGPGVVLSQLPLSYADLANQNLEGSYFTYTTLSYARLRGSTLANSNFSLAIAESADFTGAQLDGSSFFEADLASANFQSAELKAANFTRATLNQAQLENADLSNANLGGTRLEFANLTGANLETARLQGSSFNYANLSNANLMDAVINRADLRNTTSFGFTEGQLQSTASFRSKNLREVNLSLNDLSGWDFRHQDLTSARFYATEIANASFDGAIVEATDFSMTGLTSDQLYSTFSYQTRELQGIALCLNDLSGWDFTGQSLRGANFASADLSAALLTQADLSLSELRDSILNRANLRSVDLTNARMNGASLQGADLRGADLRGSQNINIGPLSNAIVTNVIRPGGRVLELQLSETETFLVRDYDGDPARLLAPIAIRIEDAMFAPSGTRVRTIFEPDPWDSLISFEPAIPVQLGGTLELAFAEGTDVATQIGRTIRIFDWTGVEPTGLFTVSSPYDWDTSALYTTGEVSLTAVPEPSGLLIGSTIVVALCVISRLAPTKRPGAMSLGRKWSEI